MSKLETLVSMPKDIIQKAGKPIVDTISSKDYWVYNTGTWLFFQPSKIIAEQVISGLDVTTSLKSRAYGFVASLLITYPMLHFSRQYEQKVWGVDENSSYAKKSIARASLGVPLSLGIYTAVLSLAGAEGRETATSVGTNLLMTIPLAILALKPWLKFLGKKTNTNLDLLNE